VRLPGCAWCYRPPENSPPLAGEPPSLRNGYVTFGSFNNMAKLNREVTSAWTEILARCPGARLLVAGAPEGSARERFIERFTSAGIEASRIRLVGRVTTPAFQRLHHEVDIALDAFPYSGGATTCESLWMGVPVVTLAGVLGFERSATGILTTLALEELIARDRTDYVDKSCALAADAGRLAALREGLRPTMQRSPLLDGRTFAARLESAYRGMWQRWCASAANAG
jgi:predicted O-linked N-acetylglucosamine transferase (SPINDLY family)